MYKMDTHSKNAASSRRGELQHLEAVSFSWSKKGGS